MSVKNTFWISLCLVAGLFLAGWHFDFQLINKIAYSILGLIILSGIWTFFSLNGIVFTRKARSLKEETGQVFEERFRVENHSPFLKSWIEVNDHSSLPGQNGSRIITWIGKNELRNYSAYTLLTNRGKYTLNPTEIKSGDPFGFFERRKIIIEPQILIVLPVSYGIHQFPLPPGYLPGGKAIRRRSSAITPHAAGIREYLPGDSLNRIHWKKAAQYGELIVKEFEEDPQSDIWIILDSEAQSHTQMQSTETPQKDDHLWHIKQRVGFKLPCDTYEYSISIVATLANYFIRIGQGIGIHSVGKQSVQIPPEKGFRQLEKIMETLAFIKADGSGTLEAGISGYIGRITPGSLVILVVTNYSIGIEKTAQALRLRKIHPFYILINNQSFDPSLRRDKTYMNWGTLTNLGVSYKEIQFGESIPSILEKRNINS
jgi:uncharacterized protein (DUF58 family)